LLKRAETICGAVYVGEAVGTDEAGEIEGVHVSPGCVGDTLGLLRVGGFEGDKVGVEDTGAKLGAEDG